MARAAAAPRHPCQPRARTDDRGCLRHALRGDQLGALRAQLLQSRTAQGIADALLATARSDTAILHGWLETQLGGDDWFVGNAFSMADIAVVPFVAGSDFHGIRLDGDHPLGRWFARVKERPSVGETLEQSHADLSLITSVVSVVSVVSVASVASVLEQGLLKRHYPDHRLEWMLRAGGLQVLLDGLATNNIRFTDIARLNDQPRLGG